MEGHVPAHLKHRIMKCSETRYTGDKSTETRLDSGHPGRVNSQADRDDVVPYGPNAYSHARQDAWAWRKQQEVDWKVKKSAEFQGKVEAEHARLTQVFMGPEGLDPEAWKRLPRKLELVARRNTQRRDMVEKLTLQLTEWDVRDKAAADMEESRLKHSKRPSDGESEPYVMDLATAKIYARTYTTARSRARTMVCEGQNSAINR